MDDDEMLKCPANVIIGGFWNVLGESPEAVYCIVDGPKKQNIGRGGKRSARPMTNWNGL